MSRVPQPPTPDELTSDALLRRFRGMRTDLLAAIEGLSDEQMTEATLDGWSVKDNFAHLAFWDDLRADEVLRISAGHESALRMTEQQDRELNALAHKLRLGLSLAQVHWELEHSRQRLEEAIAAAPPAALDPTRYGEAGLLSAHEEEHTGYITEWRRKRGY
jgi:hypothetical protein